MIKVLVVDDHKMTRAGIKLFIEQDPDIHVISEANDAEEGAALNASLNPNIVLMDLNMPKVSGIEAIKTVISKKADTKIIVLTGNCSKRKIQDSLVAGAKGFCLKEISFSNLIRAIKTVDLGETWIDSSVLNSIPGLHVTGKNNQATSNAYNLSEREMQVLALVAEGKTNPEIASAMNLSIDTARSHLRNIMNKFAVQDRTQVAVKAVREGLI